MYGKLKSSMARELRIKCTSTHLGILSQISWNFLLQEKQLGSFKIILPWEGRRTDIWNNHQPNLLTLTRGNVPTEAWAASEGDTHPLLRLSCRVRGWDPVSPGSSQGRGLSAQEAWKTILRTSLPDDDVVRGHAGFATQGAWRVVLLPSEQPAQGLTSGCLHFQGKLVSSTVAPTPTTGRSTSDESNLHTGFPTTASSSRPAPAKENWETELQGSAGRSPCCQPNYLQWITGWQTSDVGCPLYKTHLVHNF